MKRTDKIVFVIACVIATCVAAIKPDQKPSMTIQNSSIYITMDANCTIATNDNVTLAWSYMSIAEDDTLYIETRVKGSTNEEDWVQIYEGRISGQTDPVEVPNVGSWQGVVEDATNKVCHLWTKYIPPIVIHTNGVYHLTVRQVMGEDYEVITNKFITNTDFRKE